MRSGSFTGNSTDRQLDEADERFNAVEQAAREYEQHHARSTELLRSALTELYGFGEALRLQASEPGRSLIGEFVSSRGVPWNLATQRNPYIALVNLTFAPSASSRSQYAAVLAYASNCGVDPTELGDWLRQGGIKGRYAEAVRHFASPRKQRHSQERDSRLKAARQLLLDRAHSEPVALPEGIRADEGFVTLIAKIGRDGKAAIIDVIGEADEVEPILLRYAPIKATGKSALADEPLGRLFRAVDLVLGSTPDKPDGYPRHLLLLNHLERGRPVCRIEAVSEAYTYGWAGMKLSGHVDGLSAGIAYILDSRDGAFLRREFPNYTGWTVTAGDAVRIDATGLSSPLELLPLHADAAYRVSQPADVHHKPVSITHSEQVAGLQFLADRRAEHDRLNARRKEQRNFPATLKLTSDSGKLQVSLPKMPNIAVAFGSSSPDRDLSDREISIEDVKRTLVALSPYETSLDGSFIDLEVDDAALCLQAHLGDDLFSVVLPTKSGTAYNQSCADLIL